MAQREPPPFLPEFMASIGLVGVIICSGFFYDMNMHQCPAVTDECPKVTLLLVLIILVIVFVFSVLSLIVGMSEIKWSPDTIKTMNQVCFYGGLVCLGLVCTVGAFVLLPLVLHVVVIFHHHYVINAGYVTLPAFYDNTENDRLVAGEWSFALSIVVAFVAWFCVLACCCARLGQAQEKPDVVADAENGYHKL
jgi:hypothetical protein